MLPGERLVGSPGINYCHLSCGPASGLALRVRLPFVVHVCCEWDHVSVSVLSLCWPRLADSQTNVRNEVKRTLGRSTNNQRKHEQPNDYSLALCRPGPEEDY